MLTALLATAAIVCPISATLTIEERRTGERAEVELRRTSADYSGMGMWGDEWTCSYQTRGRLGNQRVLRGWYLAGQPSGGERFELLKESGQIISLSVARDRLKAGAGLESFRNYEFADQLVVAGRLHWAEKEETATDPRTTGAFLTTSFESDLVDGECPRDLYRAYHPDQANILFWGEHARRAFEALPGEAKPNYLREPEKDNGQLRCTKVRPLREEGDRYRCELAFRIKENRFIAPRAPGRTANCSYVALGNVPAARYRLLPSGELYVEGLAAEILATSGHTDCKRAPGSGNDTLCRLQLGKLR